MRILAISALMLAGAASFVSAAPAKEETGERVSYSGEKRATSHDDADWIELASPTPASHGREFITVEASYNLLRIDAHKGRPIVTSVKVVYDDGKTKTIRIGRVLGGKQPTAYVALTGANVHHIVVNTEPKSKATYTVSAARATGGVASR